MFCSQCGSALSEESQFCAKCVRAVKGERPVIAQPTHASPPKKTSRDLLVVLGLIAAFVFALSRMGSNPGSGPSGKPETDSPQSSQSEDVKAAEPKETAGALHDLGY